MVVFSSVFFAASLVVFTPVASSNAPQTHRSTDVVAHSDSFSFESWVNGIIDDPDGEHMSADEAWEAALLSWNETSTDISGTLETRQGLSIGCNTNPGQLPAANAKDAVTCIDILAARGDKKCPALGTACQVGKATISTAKRDHDTPKSQCQITDNTNSQALARSCGRIMDRCFRADGTVQGHAYSWGRRDVIVTIYDRK